MNIAVRVSSRKGNTRKLADAIAEAFGVKAQGADVPLGMEGPDKLPVDVLFLGSGTYAGKPGASASELAHDLTPGEVRRVVLFYTSASGKGPDMALREALSARGIAVAQEVIHAPGKFLFMGQGRPNAQDLQEARASALRLAKG